MGRLHQPGRACAGAAALSGGHGLHHVGLSEPGPPLAGGGVGDWVDVLSVLQSPLPSLESSRASGCSLKPQSAFAPPLQAAQFMGHPSQEELVCMSCSCCFLGVCGISKGLQPLTGHRENTSQHIHGVGGGLLRKATLQQAVEELGSIPGAVEDGSSQREADSQLQADQEPCGAEE